MTETIDWATRDVLSLPEISRRPNEMTIVLHWQQWYFLAGFGITMLSVGVRMIDREYVTAVLTTTFTALGLFVLYSAGFFTGGQ